MISVNLIYIKAIKTVMTYYILQFFYKNNIENIKYKK